MPPTLQLPYVVRHLLESASGNHPSKIFYKSEFFTFCWEDGDITVDRGGALIEHQANWNEAFDILIGMVQK